MPKITKRVVDALQPPASGEAFIWDSEIKGFGIRMMASGVASYILKYRSKQGRQRKLKLGRVGEMTPEQARHKARKCLVEVGDGADPSADRHKLRASMTVAELCDAYTEDAKGRIKDSTLDMDKSRIERHVKPLIGKRTVLSLTADDIEKLQADIIAGRTAAKRGKGRGGVTTGGKGVASRTVGMMGTMLEFARRRGLVEKNVARGIEKAPEGRQQRFLTIAEMKRLGAALRAADQEHAVFIAAVKFLLMSGCRRMEALALPMEWVDTGMKCLRFGDTKSGAQIRPVGSSALAVLAEIEHRDGWAFPSVHGSGHLVGLPKMLERICKSAGLSGVTVHVLRHSFAATAAEMGYSELTIAGLLGHRVPGVTARYAHVPDSALVSAADKISERIAGALG